MYDIYPVGGASASVYESRNEVKGEKTYTAIAWNPTDTEMTIRFTDGTKIVGSATILRERQTYIPAVSRFHQRPP